MERAQVVPRNPVERAVLLLPAERCVLTVDQAGEFAVRVTALAVVIALRHGSAQLGLCEFDLVLAETRLGEHFLE